MQMTLEIEKFGGILEADLAFDKPLSIIQGENGAAKSYITDAIRYVHGVPIRNTKASDRDRLGYNGEDFSIKWGFNGSKLKGSQSSVPKVESVAKAVKVSRKALRYCLESAEFLKTDAKDLLALKALLSEVLQLDLDWKVECINHGCDKDLVGQLPPSMKDALAEAKEERAGCKGGKAEAPEKPEDPELPTKSGPKKASEIDLKTLEKAILQVQAQREELAERYGVMKLTPQASEEERKAAIKELKSLNKKLEDLPDATDLQDELDEIIAERMKAEKAYGDLQGRQKAHDEFAKKFKKWLDVVCVKCKKKIQNLVLKAEGSMETIEKHMAKAVDDVAELQKREEKARKQIAKSDATDIVARIAELKPLTVEGASDEEIKEIKDQMDAIDARLDGGRRTRDAIRDYLHALADYNRTVASQKDQKVQWAAWDRICKAIPEVEKGGVAAGLDPLRKIMAEHKILEGEIAISDDLEISYDGRPIDLLSKAERYIVSLAPYLAVLELFEFPFVLIDDGDFIVTKSLRAKLQGVLVAIAEIKPVIFLQARPDDETEAVAKIITPDKGIALYQVKDGKVRRLAG